MPQNHRQVFRKLHRETGHRTAMLRNMVTSLIHHERIKTTVPKAKELKRLADKMVTLGKRGDLHAKRQAAAVVRDQESLKKLFGSFAERYNERHGGYTRVLRCGYRQGDGAEMAIIEYVDRSGEIRPAHPARPPGSGKRPEQLPNLKKIMTFEEYKAARDAAGPKEKKPIPSWEERGKTKPGNGNFRKLTVKDIDSSQFFGLINRKVPAPYVKKEDAVEVVEAKSS